MSSKIFLAIGLHKTGSSFLQLGIFPFLKGIKYMHIRDGRPIITEFHKDWDNDKILLASEALSGAPWMNDYKRRNKYKNFEYRNLNWIEKYKNSVRNIKKLFPEAKIIIVFRKHSSMIESIYKQYLHEGGHKNVSDFFNIDNERHVINKEELFYRKRIELIHDLFSEENVFVSTYETMKENKVLFIQKLLYFMEINEKNDASALLKLNDKNINVGVKRTQGKLLRIFNLMDMYLSKTKVLPTFNNKIFTKLGINPRKLFQYRLKWIDKRNLELEEDYKNKIDEYYKEDWNRIQSYLR